MANNLDIAEYTLEQVSGAATACNVIGVGVGNRSSWDQDMVIRITDHDDDTTLEEDDPNLMALFTSCAHGQPWKKDANVLKHVVVQADADPGANPTRSDVSVLFPNYDYSTFE